MDRDPKDRVHRGEKSTQHHRHGSEPPGNNLTRPESGNGLPTIQGLLRTLARPSPQLPTGSSTLRVGAGYIEIDDNVRGASILNLARWTDSISSTQP